MFNQIIFNVVLYLSGYIFLLAFTSLNRWLVCIMSYITSLALWGIIATFLVVMQIKLTLFFLVLSYLAITLLTYKLINIKTERLSIKKELFYACIGCGAIATLTILFFKYNLIHLSPDSYRYVLIGHSIEEFGYFNRDYFGWEYAVKGRMSFLPLIYAVSKFFKIDFFYTLFPITAFVQVLLVPSIVYKLTRDFSEIKYVRYFFCFLSTATIATIPAYWWHAFYVSNNLLVSVCFTISLSLVLIYYEERNIDWLLISAMFLGATSLLRTEMTFFASIVIIILLGLKNLSRKDYFVFLCIFIVIALPWQLYRIILLGLGRHTHGWGLFQLIAFILYGGSYLFVCFDYMRQIFLANIIKIYLFMLFIVLMIVLTIFSSEAIDSLKYLLTIISQPVAKHNWSIFWIILSCFFVYDLLFIKSSKTFIFGSAIAIFMTYRVLLYALPFISTNAYLLSAHENSGNRILLHILPVCVIYVCYLCIYAFSITNISNNKFMIISKN